MNGTKRREDDGMAGAGGLVEMDCGGIAVCAARAVHDARAWDPASALHRVVAHAVATMCASTRICKRGLMAGGSWRGCCGGWPCSGWRPHDGVRCLGLRWRAPTTGFTGFRATWLQTHTQAQKRKKKKKKKRKKGKKKEGRKKENDGGRSLHQRNHFASVFFFIFFVLLYCLCMSHSFCS